MSTAGKVLVVLIMLASLGWMVLMAGVTQLNRSGNKAVNELTEKIEKLVEDVKTAQARIVKIKDDTTVVQEQMDRDLTVVRSRQNDVERVNSNIREILSRVQNQVATLEQTVKDAERTAKERADEKVAEQNALESQKAVVENLKAQNSELMNRLTGLRNEFKTTLKGNQDLLGREVR
jgi:chromosome segregation ATPase